MLDQNNDYSSAGPGFKRRRQRERLTLEKKHRSKPYLGRPKPAKEETTKRETMDISPRGLRARVQRLTLRHEAFGDVYDELKRANFPSSAVLCSALRNETLQIVKLMIEEGLLDRERLDRYRKTHAKDLRKNRQGT
ncbi:hypothetical protein [Bradyrhizobium arachidis]|uniref:hypothetical protein n=1 Tax=Bradyrhizobium arachidis TaxID=858423 RepID=UPI00216239C5|nr:hypothetical protein [Bradyrhizobium arachidis]UVO28339.1 hypothetical protein KUF59_38755 [Bradyrhizobium arachidis]